MHQVSFALGMAQVVVFVAFTQSSGEATSCLQSKLRVGLPADPLALGVGVYSPSPGVEWAVAAAALKGVRRHFVGTWGS